jgi:hypothetical protein
VAAHQDKKLAEFEEAPARFLDQLEELGMDLSNEDLISAAVKVNHAKITGKTLERSRITWSTSVNTSQAPTATIPIRPSANTSVCS